MRDGLSYEDWKSDVNIWSDVTELAAEKQGGAVFLTLVGKAQATVRAGVTREQMKEKDGLKQILLCLDGLYKEDAARSAFAAYEHFTEFKRSHDMSIEDYLVEFNIRYNKIKTLKMVLPDGVLAYYLLKCASLSDEQSNICKATCDKLTYKEMREKIERVTSASKKSHDNTSDVTPFYGDASYYEDSPEFSYVYDEDYDTCDAEPEGECVNDKEEKAYYIPSSSRGRSSGSTYRHPHYGSVPMAPRLNAPDEYGNPSRCSFCKSVYHYVGACTDAKLAQQHSRFRGGASSRRGAGVYRGRGPRGGRGMVPKFI